MDSKIDEKQEVSNGGINLLSGTPPTEGWNFLDEGAYSGEFEEVGAGIYTNVYFKGYDCYVVHFSSLRRPSIGRMSYWLMDMTTGTFSVEKQSNMLNDKAEGTCGNAFTGLDVTHKYCVWIRASGGPADLSGNILVSVE